LNPAFEATVFASEDPGAMSGASSSRWAVWLQRLVSPFRELPAEARDRSTGLYNRAGLLAAANEAIRARAGGWRCSMVVVDFADLHEVYDIYGNAIARKVVARIVRRLRVLAGLRGFAGRTGPAQFTVVLPGATQARARRLVQRALGAPARIEFDAGDSEIVLVPHLLVDTAEPGAESIQPLYRDMCAELARVQEDELRRLHWLTTTRERHSRPMRLAPR